MDGRGSQTQMPRAALPRGTDGASTIVLGFAVGFAILFAAGQVVTVLAAAPAAIAFHREAGAAPWFVSLVSSLGWLGILATLSVLDAAILAGFLWLSHRYWVGFAFLPPLLYLGTGAVMLWLLVARAVSWVLLSR